MNGQPAPRGVAGAIKDHKAGVLVGNTTFGKSVVQDVIPLANGGALTLTVANYRTAGGLSIHKKDSAPCFGACSQGCGRGFEEG